MYFDSALQHYAKQLRDEYPVLLDQSQVRLNEILEQEKRLTAKIETIKSKAQELLNTSFILALVGCFPLLLLIISAQFIPLQSLMAFALITVLFFAPSIYFFSKGLRYESSASGGVRDARSCKENLMHLQENKKRCIARIEAIVVEGLINRHKKAEQSLINGNQSPLDKKEFVEASRALMEFQRGDAITIYDEAKIQNDLEALTIKASYEIKGDHVDNRQSVYIEKIDQSSTIHQAATDSIVESEADAKRAILKLLHTTPSGNASIVELMVSIKANELIIRQALDSLMIQGLVRIGNREDGVIIYSIDYLMS